MQSELTIVESQLSSARNSSEILVKAENVGKKFCRDLKQSLWYGFKDVAAELIPFAGGSFHKRTSKLRKGEFWANSGVSFELRRGECLGLIGHNGAGKTTLLKMLNGLLKPDTGSIEMKGNVGALIALGAGFNPILTGRENIYVNGAVLGLSKREITQKIEEIIDFSEIAEFIDTPVQSYSSGMKVRLGFSIAVKLLKPDVLILDEVLAVGDAKFKGKCEIAINDLVKDAAVILVSHNANHIRKLCDRVLWLSRGTMHKEGTANEILPEFVSEGSDEFVETLTTRESVNHVSITNFPKAIDKGGSLDFSLKIETNLPTKITNITVGICVSESEPAAQIDLKTEIEVNGPVHLNIKTGPLMLKENIYCLNLVLFSDHGKTQLVRHQAAKTFQVKGEPTNWSFYQPEATVTIVS